MEANEVERKRWRIVLAIGIVLCFGPLLGDIGSIAAMQYFFDHTKALSTSTPVDLRLSAVLLSLVGMAAGLAACGAGVPLVLWSCMKLGRLRNETPVFR